MVPMVIPSTPALPLLAFTRRNASFRFSRSHTSSISRSVLAGLSHPFVASDDSVSVLPASGFTRQRARAVQWRLDVLRVVHETHGLLASPSIDPAPAATPAASFKRLYRE